MPRTQRGECKPSTSRIAVSSRSVESSDENSDSETNNTTSRTTEDITHLVTNFVKYILNFSTTKTPIKRTDLSKALNIHQKDFASVHAEGLKILKNVYGLDLAEVPESKSGKLYLVCSSLPNITALAMPLQQRQEATALFITLAFIFMKGGDVLEEHLLQFLSEVQLHFSDEDTEEEIKKLVKLFIQQLYIKRTKVEIENRNEPEIHLSWGYRADLEFDKKKLLESVGKIMQKSPLSFMTQYTEAFGATHEDVVMIE